jgi:Fe2+ or Zn2+ uptake regulation protein/O6-methylguanine-DNA--protein-cysteine methyltransferase
MMSDDDIARILRERELRVTPQRRAILQAFRGRAAEHLSADEVLSRASVIVPEIGRGTVYATLAELTELGVLASVGNPEPVRYETNLADHDHFHCRLCLRLFDVDLGGRQTRHRRLSGYDIERVAIRGEGICAQCRDFERGVVDGAARVIGQPTVNDEAAVQLSCARVSTPLGELAMAASSEGVTHVAFEDHADFDILVRRARSRRGSVAGRDRCVDLGSALERYFGGFRGRAQDIIDWRFVSPQTATALTSVIEIPYGEPLSYDRIAGELDAYEWGVAVGSNPLPLLVPCHRVSCGSRRLEAYVGGSARLGLIRDLEAG